MRESVKNAVFAWGSGFVTATTFGAVVPGVQPITVPMGSAVPRGAITENLRGLERNLRKVGAKNRETLAVHPRLADRRQNLLERMRQLNNRLHQ